MTRPRTRRFRMTRPRTRHFRMIPPETPAPMILSGRNGPATHSTGAGRLTKSTTTPSPAATPPRSLFAARMYVEDNDWQAVVSDLLNQRPAGEGSASSANFVGFVLACRSYRCNHGASIPPGTRLHDDDTRQLARTTPATRRSGGVGAIRAAVYGAAAML